MQQQFPICPGCHMRCDLIDPQCGKGYMLVKEWRQTGQLPERRGPGGPGGPGAQGGPGRQAGPNMRRGMGGPMGVGGSAGRLRFMMGIAANQVQAQTECLNEVQFLGMLRRQGDFMKFSVLEEKARMNRSQLQQLLPKLEREGLVELDWDAVMLTDEGAAAADGAQDYMAQVCNQVFSALDEEEQEQLGTLLDKLLQSWR